MSWLKMFACVLSNNLKKNLCSNCRHFTTTFDKLEVLLYLNQFFQTYIFNMRPLYFKISQPIHLHFLIFLADCHTSFLSEQIVTTESEEIDMLSDI